MAIRGVVPNVLLPPLCECFYLGFDRADLAAVIVAAACAQIVGQAKLAAIRAFLVVGRLQRVVAAAHIALRRRGFSFRDGHPGTCSNSFEFMIRASGSQYQRLWGPRAWRPVLARKATSQAGLGWEPERCRL